MNKKEFKKLEEQYRKIMPIKEGGELNCSCGVFLTKIEKNINNKIIECKKCKRIFIIRSDNEYFACKIME